LTIKVQKICALGKHREQGALMSNEDYFDSLVKNGLAQPNETADDSYSLDFVIRANQLWQLFKVPEIGWLIFAGEESPLTASLFDSMNKLLCVVRFCGRKDPTLLQKVLHLLYDNAHNNIIHASDVSVRFLRDDHGKGWLGSCQLKLQYLAHFLNESLSGLPFSPEQVVYINKVLQKPSSYRQWAGGHYFDQASGSWTAVEAGRKCDCPHVNAYIQFVADIVYDDVWACAIRVANRWNQSFDEFMAQKQLSVKWSGLLQSIQSIIPAINVDVQPEQPHEAARPALAHTQFDLTMNFFKAFYPTHLLLDVSQLHLDSNQMATLLEANYMCCGTYVLKLHRNLCLV
jgi:hypothetical protein